MEMQAATSFDYYLLQVIAHQALVRIGHSKYKSETILNQ